MEGKITRTVGNKEEVSKEREKRYKIEEEKRKIDTLRTPRQMQKIDDNGFPPMTPKTPVSPPLRDRDDAMFDPVWIKVARNRGNSEGGRKRQKDRKRFCRKERSARAGEERRMTSLTRPLTDTHPEGHPIALDP